MSTWFIVLSVIAAIAVIMAMFARYSHAVMMMQQNSYRIDRFQRWANTANESTSMPFLLGLVVIFACLATFMRPASGLIVMVMYGVYISGTLIGKKYKKPLVWTPRVRRIYSVMLALSVVGLAGAFALTYCQSGAEAGIYYTLWAAVVLLCNSRFVVIAAVWLLKPVEKRINQKFYDEAAAILRSMPDLKVVGITGSYGKTSTKHYLQRILSEHFETLMTPGSFNTTLGVIRTVREMMKPYCEVFICEMGAKQQGDIKEICDLVHPTMGIVTAVGPQHLESFKSIENVQKTKFELVDALPADGLAVVNNDFEYIANRPVDNVECVRYGVKDDEAGYRAVDIAYDRNGAEFTVVGPDTNLRLRTRLVGECNVSNLIAAVVVALRLGVPEEKIRRAVERIEPVEHRLSMKRTPGGVTIIDDAFNSNPSGSAMALDVLAAMTPGKRIIITPGMIELGEKQYELNFEFGQHIARSADVAIVVGEYNRAAIVEGIASQPAPKAEVIEAATFAEAQQRLATIVSSGDTVLYENDLPDTFK